LQYVFTLCFMVNIIYPSPILEISFIPISSWALSHQSLYTSSFFTFPLDLNSYSKNLCPVLSTVKINE
jgi:hypothetical protein